MFLNFRSPESLRGQGVGLQRGRKLLSTARTLARRNGLPGGTSTSPTLSSCPGSSHILTPTRFLDDLKTLDQKLEDMALP